MWTRGNNMFISAFCSSSKSCLPFFLCSGDRVRPSDHFPRGCVRYSLKSESAEAARRGEQWRRRLRLGGEEDDAEQRERHRSRDDDDGGEGQGCQLPHRVSPAQFAANSAQNHTSNSTCQICMNKIEVISGHLLQSFTELPKMVCTWLREVCSCSCLPVLPGSAWVLLSKIYKPFMGSLYSNEFNS